MLKPKFSTPICSVSMEDHHYPQGPASDKAKVYDESTMREGPSFNTWHQYEYQEPSGLLRTNFGDLCDRYYRFQSEAGKSGDPRMLRLLEFFRELYYRRRETFKKLFPAKLEEEFKELFKEMDAQLNKVKSKSEGRTMQRSLSLGSSRSRGGSGFKLERFKVRTVIVDGVGGGGGGGVQQGGQGDKCR